MLKWITIFKLPYNGIIFLSQILSFTFLFNFGLVLLLYVSSLLDEFLPVVVIILEVFIINPLYICNNSVFLICTFRNTLDNDFKEIFYYLKYDTKSLLIVILLLLHYYYGCYISVSYTAAIYKIKFIWAVSIFVHLNELVIFNCDVFYRFYAVVENFKTDTV